MNRSLVDVCENVSWALWCCGNIPPGDAGVLSLMPTIVNRVSQLVVKRPLSGSVSQACHVAGDHVSVTSV